MGKRKSPDLASLLGVSPNLNPQTPPDRIAELPDFVREVESHLSDWEFWIEQREQLEPTQAGRSAPRALSPTVIAARFGALGRDATALHKRAMNFHLDLSHIRTHDWGDGGGTTGHFGVAYGPMPENAKKEARCFADLARRFLILGSVQGTQAPLPHIQAIRAVLLRMSPPPNRSVLGDDALVDHVQIAKAWGEKPENVRKRLSNARRRKNLSLDDYSPVDCPKKGKPRWRYRYGAIKFLKKS